MAAKKAATKSRSSKSNKNKNNLKWWYVLPVIAIVAVAGYAIVRFSEAGTSSNRLSGGTRWVDKGNGNRAREVGGSPVTATWSASQRGSQTTFCATTYMSNGDGQGSAKLTLISGGSVIGNSRMIYGRGTTTQCLYPDGGQKSRIFLRNATLKVTRINGYVSVYNMFVTQ